MSGFGGVPSKKNEQGVGGWQTQKQHSDSGDPRYGHIGSSSKHVLDPGTRILIIIGVREAEFLSGRRRKWLLNAGRVDDEGSDGLHSGGHYCARQRESFKLRAGVGPVGSLCTWILLLQPLLGDFF